MLLWAGMRFLSWRFLFKFFTITKQRGLPRNMIYSLSMHQLLAQCQGKLEPGREGRALYQGARDKACAAEAQPVVVLPEAWLDLAGPRLKAPAPGLANSRWASGRFSASTRTCPHSLQGPILTS